MGHPFAAPQQGPASARFLLVHYHLFKNAGSSVDAILRANFAERWRAAEFPAAPATQLPLVAQLLAEDRELTALSSHTLRLPPGRIPGAAAIPIVFLRHPLDRLKSAHNFERMQEADTRGARLARQHDLLAISERGWPTPRSARAGISRPHVWR